MELTTRCLEPGYHRVLADGKPTMYYLNRSTEPGQELGWWVDDDRLDYRDRRGEPYSTMHEALTALEEYVVWAAGEWVTPAEILGLEEEVGS